MSVRAEWKLMAHLVTAVSRSPSSAVASSAMASSPESMTTGTPK